MNNYKVMIKCKFKYHQKELEQIGIWQTPDKGITTN